MNIGKIKNFLLKLLKLLGYLVIAFVCLCVAFLVYYIISSQIHANDEDYKPAISIYTIVSPSMTPVINVYDVVVNTRVNDPENIQVGDIITYVSKAPTSEGMTITHRVVAIAKADDGTIEFMTQGDNNSEPDSLYVRYDQVIGKEILIIPVIGRLQFLLANQKGWLFLLLIPISIYVLFEIYKLIDLFGLRKKVNTIVGTTEESFIERKKEQKQQEIERKIAIKEELKLETQYKDSLIRSEKEPVGFLESYNESTYSVAKNKYIKTPTETKQVKVKNTEIPVKVSSGKVEPVKEKVEKVEKPEKVEIELPKIKENPYVINKPIEILDTDELTSKIKEYDTKIEKLDKMIADIEKIPVPEKKEKAEIVEKDNYLSKKKIKVKAVEPTKNQKKPAPTRRKKKVEEPKTEFKPSLTQTIELTQITNLENKRMKVERPVTEDIKVVRERDLAKEEKEKKPTKKKLNLNPKEIKTVSRKTTKKAVEVEVEKKVTPKVEVTTKEVLPPKVTVEINRNQVAPKKEVNITEEKVTERKIDLSTREVPTETTIEINRRINQVQPRKTTKTTEYEEESNKKVKVELNRDFERNVETTEKKKYPPLIEIRKVR